MYLVKSWTCWWCFSYNLQTVASLYLKTRMGDAREKKNSIFHFQKCHENVKLRDLLERILTVYSKFYTHSNNHLCIFPKFLSFSNYRFNPWSLWRKKVGDLQALCRQPLWPKLLLQYLLRGACKVLGPGFQQCRGGSDLDNWAEISHGWHQWWRQSGP